MEEYGISLENMVNMENMEKMENINQMTQKSPDRRLLKEKSKLRVALPGQIVCFF